MKAQNLVINHNNSTLCLHWTNKKHGLTDNKKYKNN